MLKDPFDIARAIIVVVFLPFALLGLLSRLGVDFGPPAQLAQVSISVIPASSTGTSNFSSSIYGINQQVAGRVSAAAKAGVSVSPDAELQGLLTRRKEYMTALAKENPRLFLQLTLPAAVRSKLPSAYKDFVEQSLSGDATMDVLHVDDFNNPANSRFDYYLTVPKRASVALLGDPYVPATSSERLNFYPTSPLTVRSNTKVRLSGGVRLGTLAVADTTQNVTVVSEPPPEAVGDQKTLVLLVKFKNSPLTNPFTKEEAYELVFKSQFKQFMQEQSYYKVSFSGDVYGWYTVPRDGSGVVCMAISRDDVGAIVKAYNIDPSKYGRLIVLPNPDQGDGGCSYVGKTNFVVNGVAYNWSSAYIGTYDFSQPSWRRSQPFSWTNLDSVLAHEVGHSLGLYHANGLDCGTSSIYASIDGDCQHIEYGNYFDTMGTLGYSLHFNAFYKRILGWLTASDIIEIRLSGRYSLSALESISGKRLALIYPQNQTSPAYALEFRKARGFDLNLGKTDLKSNTEGLLLNKISSDGTAKLIDAQPTSLHWEGDIGDINDINRAEISWGSSFEDKGRGITILPLVQAATSSAAFDVKIATPVCVAQRPNVFYLTNSPVLAAGGTLKYYFTISNAEPFSCGSSEFELLMTLPAGWRTAEGGPQKITIAPEAGGSLFADILVPLDAPVGLYTLAYRVKNLRNGLETAYTLKVSIIAPLIVKSITPAMGQVGTDVTLTGSGFDRIYNLLYFTSFDGNLASTFLLPSETGLSLLFKVPRELGDSATCGGGGGGNVGSGECHTVPTPPGLYRIIVAANGSESKAVDFTVTAPSVLSITPGRVTVNSGDKVTLRFTEPPNVVARKFFVSCPTGLISVGICNTWQTFSGPVNLYEFAITNTATTSKNAVPNLYVYTADNPTFATGVSSEITVRADTTPPTVPSLASVSLGSGALQSSWTTASDLESGIAEYQYALGTSAGASDAIAWTSTGLTTNIRRTVSIPTGRIYYFSIRAKNGAGLWSTTTTSSGLRY